MTNMLLADMSASDFSLMLPVCHRNNSVEFVCVCVQISELSPMKRKNHQEQSLTAVTRFSIFFTKVRDISWHTKSDPRKLLLRQ